MKTLQNTTDNNGRLEAGKLVVSFMVIFMLILLVAESSAQVVNGNSGHCRSFDGSTSNVTFSNNDLGLGSGNTMTVTAWVRCNSTVNEGGWANVVTLNNSTSNGDDGQFWLQHSSDNSLFEFAVENKSSNRTYVQSVTAPVNGVWYHVAGVYDGSFIYLYVNGVMETKTAQTGNINNYQGNFNLNFGQWSYNGNAYRRFNGDIDEVTIWNTALTQTQIRTNMCQSLKGNEAGLAGYWRMNETGGTSVYDKTSNSRAGTAANTKIVWSGAPIGNASSFTYGGTRLGLSNPTYHDSLVVNTFSTTPTGVFIYRIDTAANYTTAPAGYSALATNYYYGIFIVGSATPTYTMTYYYTGNPYASSPSLIGMVSRFDDTVSTWANVSATLNLVTKTFQKTSQSGRNEYNLGLIKKVLPIQLASFNAEPVNNNVEITWATSTETNNNYFTIERTTDGINYEQIAQVDGAGNSDQLRNYSTMDNSPVEGVSYYRLTQTDYDGHSKTFPMVAVTFSANSTTNGIELQSAYPNPFKSNFTMNVNCTEAGAVTMEIVNLSGTVIDKSIISCEKGANTYEYSNGYMLPAGIYFIYLTNESNNQKTVKKIVKG